MTNTHVPAGWYPDPAGEQNRLRYWDGVAWTKNYHHVAPYGDQPANQAQPYPHQTQPFMNQPQTLSTYQIPPQPAPLYTVTPVPQTTGREGFATASLVLGIFSVLGCCFLNEAAKHEAYVFLLIFVLTGILAITFGFIGIKSARKGMAIAGLVIGFALVALTLLFMALGLMMYANTAPTNTFYDYVVYK